MMFVHQRGSAPLIPEHESISASAKRKRNRYINKYDFDIKKRDYFKLLHCNGESMERRSLTKPV
jgi:hypothetical protein